jgi:hypothetical protein
LSGEPSEWYFWNQLLGAENLPAFGTTCIDNGTTGTGAHPRTESMGALTFQIAGLECSFHDLNHCLTIKFTYRHFGGNVYLKRAATILPNRLAVNRITVFWCVFPG